MNRKNIITLTQRAVNRIKELADKEGKLLRIGVKTRGCSGLTYTLDYVDKKSKLDEEIIQDGIKVLVDSKAMLSVIGTEMDFTKDPLCSQFVFNNPNVKETCGCGQSFMV